MLEKNKKIHSFFSNTSSYINNNLVIELRSKLINSNLNYLSQKEILDVGCGNGDISLPFLYNNNKVTFLDISESMLEIVKTKIPGHLLNSVEFINMNFENFFSKKDYDLIILLGVIAHVESLSLVFSKLVDYLKKDGILVIQYTDKNNLLSLILRIIRYIKSLFGIKYGYEINYTSSKEINELLRLKSLFCFNKISYWPALPGFKFLPMGLRRCLFFKVMNNSSFKEMGSEKILFLKILHA